MKLECVNFKKEHMFELLKHPSQAAARAFISPEDVEAIEGAEYSYSILENGEPIAALGLRKFWEGRYEAWAIILDGHKSAFLFIHNKVRDFLRDVKVRRIEATVEMNFLNGHKWAMMLGFRPECDTLKAYGPTGKDYRLYTMVREIA